MMKLIYDSHLRRPAIFVLGNVAVFAVAVFGLVIPTYAFFADRDDRILEQTRVLTRLSAIAAQAVNVESMGSETNTQMRGDEFLSGPNENVISADLQARLKSVIEAAGARSRAVQALPLNTFDQIRYSGSRIEIFGPLQAIHRAVYAIESAKPYLFITGATIKGPPSVGRQGVPEEPVIQAQLDVFGAIQLSGQKP